MTCAKIRKIINNSAGDCSILLKFRTDFDHMTLDATRTFKVNGSKVKVAAWQSVSASEKSYNSGTDKLSKVKLVKIIPELSATCNTMFKVIRSNTEIAITPPLLNQPHWLPVCQCIFCKTTVLTQKVYLSQSAVHLVQHFATRSTALPLLTIDAHSHTPRHVQ